MSDTTPANDLKYLLLSIPSLLCWFSSVNPWTIKLSVWFTIRVNPFHPGNPRSCHLHCWSDSKPGSLHIQRNIVHHKSTDRSCAHSNFHIPIISMSMHCPSLMSSLLCHFLVPNTLPPPKKRSNKSLAKLRQQVRSTNLFSETRAVVMSSAKCHVSCWACLTTSCWANVNDHCKTIMHWHLQTQRAMTSANCQATCCLTTANQSLSKILILHSIWHFHCF